MIQWICKNGDEWSMPNRVAAVLCPVCGTDRVIQRARRRELVADTPEPEPEIERQAVVPAVRRMVQTEQGYRPATKLVASMLVKDELGRYLKPCIESLLTFCDEVRVIDDGSTDGSWQWLSEQDRVEVLVADDSAFFRHEGRARQALLDWTLEGTPTHILAIDADEFVADGSAIVKAIDGQEEVWTLTMQEVWKAFGECLCVRQDGGWCPHPAPILFRVPTRPEPTFRIRDLALSCGREPEYVRRQARNAGRPITKVLHFGWTAEAERAARHERYVQADGGRFHASAHLDSIVWPDERVEMESRDWPASLEPWRAAIVETGGRSDDAG